MNSSGQNGIWQPIDVFGATRANMPLSTPVVSGIVRRGETMNVVAETKIGKSWLALDLGLSVVSGTPWLGYDVTPGKVLIIDNELERSLATNRCWDVANAKCLTRDTLMAKFYLESLRGQLQDIYAVKQQIEQCVQPNEFSLIILDALYRFYPDGYDENSNAHATKIYNMLDSVAKYTNAAIAVVHHSSKGYQGSKRNTDVGSGAGAISRAADTHLVLRSTSQESTARMTVSTRSFAPPESIDLSFTWPLWSVATQPAQSSSRWTPELFAQSFLTTTPQTTKALRVKATASGLSWRECQLLLSQCAELPSVAYSPKVGSRAATYAVVLS